jgi:hypothetical protein
MPDEPSLTDIVKTGLEQKIPLQILKRPPLSDSHQADADRRDEAIERQERVPRPKKSYNSSHEEDTTREMTRALIGKSMLVQSRSSSPDNHLKLYTIKIAAIGGPGFYRHMQKKKNEIFVTSIYEIDHIISEKAQHSGPDYMPKQYKAYTDVASKAKSDELPEHRDVDCRFDTGDAKFTPGYCPLYKMS